jgi:hypothetical protein
LFELKCAHAAIRIAGLAGVVSLGLAPLTLIGAALLPGQLLFGAAALLQLLAACTCVVAGLASYRLRGMVWVLGGLGALGALCLGAVTASMVPSTRLISAAPTREARS